MPEYGLTQEGVEIKRLDVILDDIHDDLTEKFGVNTRQNEESYLNHILTNIADRLSELWEYGINAYHSMYPSSAEGISLDRSLEFGGILREQAKPSYYYIKCTGLDGTVIPKGTAIASATNPPVNLILEADMTISRERCCEAEIIVTDTVNTLYQIVVDGDVSYSGNNLTSLAVSLNDDDEFTAEVFTIVDEGIEVLRLHSQSETSSYNLTLSNNLTTKTVSSIHLFATEENGDIRLPKGIITEITKGIAGLDSVVNVGSYIAGRLKETDSELRQSHINKIFRNSTCMTESIRSAILDNVQGVESCSVYENDTNEWDEFGRPPHSVEVVVAGGDKVEIAQQIQKRKAGGIFSFGNESVELKGNFGENITIRFNRPQEVKMWFKVVYEKDDMLSLPSNYEQLIKGVISEYMSSLSAGEDVSTQKEILSKLYKTVSGVTYFDIYICSGEAPASESDYSLRKVAISERQKAVLAKDTQSLKSVTIRDASERNGG